MATSSSVNKQKRVSETDYSSLEELFKAAALLLVPDNQSQHQTFLRLMPYIYVVRNRGCSFVQIANLLAQCNLSLQPSTVKDYYNNALASRMDICQQRMNEQILLLADIRKETKDVDVADIASRAAVIMQNQKAGAKSHLDAIFGAQGANNVSVVAPTTLPAARTTAPVSGAVVPSGGDGVENKKTGLRPDPANLIPVANVSLVNVKVPISPSKKNPPTDDFSPPIPVLHVSPIDGENSPAVPLRCLALQPGVKPLKKRDGFDESVYQHGNLEHPCIDGLMLSLDERLYGAHLEYANISGEVILETPDEKRFRVLWRKPIPMTRTTTDDKFTEMNASLFKKR